VQVAVLKRPNSTMCTSSSRNFRAGFLNRCGALGPTSQQQQQQQPRTRRIIPNLTAHLQPHIRRRNQQRSTPQQEQEESSQAQAETQQPAEEKEQQQQQEEGTQTKEEKTNDTESTTESTAAPSTDGSENEESQQQQQEQPTQQVVSNLTSVMQTAKGADHGNDASVSNCSAHAATIITAPEEEAQSVAPMQSVTFEPNARIHPIPTHSRKVPDHMRMTSDEDIKHRDVLDFPAERFNWRKAIEDDEMINQGDDLLHPSQLSECNVLTPFLMVHTKLQQCFS